MLRFARTTTTRVRMVLATAHSQHSKLRRTASSVYARLNSTAAASHGDVASNCSMSLSTERLLAGSRAAEHFHHEHLAALLAEAGLGLFRQNFEQARMLAPHLSAHGVGGDLQLRIAVQPVDEILDRRNVV